MSVRARRALFLAALALAPMTFSEAIASPTRQDVVYTSMSSQELADVLTVMGITAEQGTDPTGDPQLKFEMNGFTILLVTYGCEAGSCKSVQLYAGFSMTGKKKVSLEKINEWNRDRRFGRAYIDTEGDPVVEYDLDLEGGVTKGAVEEWIRTFGSIVSTFATHIGFA